MSKNQILYDNLTKPQENSLNLIQSLGIYELRALARVFGDNSPTTSKRMDHIKIIMDKIISGEDLKPIPLRQGRPYKELSNIEGILEELSQINGKNYTSKNSKPITPVKPVKTITFRQVESETVKKKLFPIEVSGIVLNKGNDELYIINEFNNKPILIRKEDSAILQEFDYVTGTAVVMNSENEYIINDIKTINFVKRDNYSPVTYSCEPTLPTQSIKISNKEIKLGARYLIEQNELENHEALKNIVDEFKKNNVLCIALIPNAMYEDSIILSQVGFNHVYLINYNDTPADYDEKINIFMQYISRLQELGKNVAIFVKDINTITNNLDAYYKTSSKTYFNHTDETGEIIKELVMLAKACKDHSTTLIVTHDETDNFDPLYLTSIYKVSKTI